VEVYGSWVRNVVWTRTLGVPSTFTASLNEIRAREYQQGKGVCRVTKVNRIIDLNTDLGSLYDILHTWLVVLPHIVFDRQEDTLPIAMQKVDSDTVFAF